MYHLAFGTARRIPSGRPNRLNVLVGLPPTIICMWGSTLANAALFALIFPSVSI